MHLGDAHQTANGSIEVRVSWAPTVLTCDQSCGEQTGIRGGEGFSGGQIWSTCVGQGAEQDRLKRVK